MLSLWRRHTPKCPYRKKGRAHIKCKCPIWVDGELEGKRFRRSTGLRDWQRALRRVAAWESKETASIKPIAEAVEAFLADCRHLSQGTLLKYRNVMRNLAAFCAKESIGSVAELSVEALDAYREQRAIGLLTGVKELQTLRQFCTFCLERKWLRENPAAKIRMPKNVRPAPIAPYTVEEMARILFACGEFGRARYERLRARTMVLLLRHTGLRISDVATLARERVRDGEILLQTLKTGATVKLPVPRELALALEALLLPKDADAACPYFFWNGKMSERAVIRNARRTLGAVFRKARVAGARTHRFRHTLATDILVKGGTEQDVADVLGISPAIVRKHYAKWTVARQERISTLMRRVQATDAVAVGLEEPIRVN